jgi:hypothetical protein
MMNDASRGTAGPAGAARGAAAAIDRTPIPPITWVVGVAAVAIMLVSLRWVSLHDTPILMYVGFAMDKLGKYPYRDLFDMQPPGTHLLHAAVYHLVGHSELGLRLLDVAVILAIQAGLVVLLWPFGWIVGATAAAAYALQVLGYGPKEAFQREHLAMLPLVASLVIAFRVRANLVARALVIGLLHGIMSSIKPTLVVSLPIVLAGMFMDEAMPRAAGGERGRPRTGGLAFVLGGIAALAGVAVVWQQIFHALAAHGAMAGFREVARDYWPLYSQLRWDASVRTHAFELRRFTGLVAGLRFYRMLPLALLGAWSVTRWIPRDRRAVLVGTVFALGVGELFYAFLNGKYWSYHYTPLALAGAPFVGLLAARAEPFASGRRRTAWRVTIPLLALACIRVPEGTRDVLAGRPYPVPPDILRAAADLRERLRPGDTVQPLDATAGALHAMFLAHADIATPFLHDFPFYHHPASAMTRRLRARFLASMAQARPRFIVEATPSIWRPRGPETAEFPELTMLVESDYHPLWRGERLTLYERNGP